MLIVMVAGLMCRGALEVGWQIRGELDAEGPGEVASATRWPVFEVIMVIIQKR